MKDIFSTEGLLGASVMSGSPLRKCPEVEGRSSLGFSNKGGIGVQYLFDACMYGIEFLKSE